MCSVDGHAVRFEDPSTTSPSRERLGRVEVESGLRKFTPAVVNVLGDLYTQSAQPAGQEHAPDDVCSVAVIHALAVHDVLDAMAAGCTLGAAPECPARSADGRRNYQLFFQRAPAAL